METETDRDALLSQVRGQRPAQQVRHGHGHKVDFQNTKAQSQGRRPVRGPSRPRTPQQLILMMKLTHDVR